MCAPPSLRRGLTKFFTSYVNKLHSVKAHHHHDRLKYVVPRVIVPVVASFVVWNVTTKPVGAHATDLKCCHSLSHAVARNAMQGPVPVAWSKIYPRY